MSEDSDERATPRPEDRASLPDVRPGAGDSDSPRPSRPGGYPTPGGPAGVEGSAGEFRQAAFEFGVVEHVSSPTLLPHVLKQYDDIQPGFADRVLSMTEKALEGDEDRLNALAMTEVRAAREGPRLFTGIMLALITAAFFLALNDNNVGAGLFLSASVLTAASRLLPGRSA